MFPGERLYKCTAAHQMCLHCLIVHCYFLLFRPKERQACALFCFQMIFCSFGWTRACAEAALLIIGCKHHLVVTVCNDRPKRALGHWKPGSCAPVTCNPSSVVRWSCAITINAHWQNCSKFALKSETIIFKRSFLPRTPLSFCTAALIYCCT